MSQPQTELSNRSFEAHVQTLALTLQPFTVVKYQYVARRFLGYLRATFPEVRRLSQLRRDPHLLGWFRWLCEQRPPLATILASSVCSVFAACSTTWPPRAIAIQPGLIIREDFPVRPEYLPRASVPGRRSTTARGTAPHRQPVFQCAAAGCASPESVLENASTWQSIVCVTSRPEQWALHVPLGKLHTERLVPLDAEGLRLLARILELRAQASPARLRKSEGFLLPRVVGRFALFQTLRVALADFAKTSRLCRHQPDLASPLAPYLGLGHAPLRDQPARSQGTDGAQRHPHDPSLSEGHPT